MKIRLKKTWASALGLVLAVTTIGGVALAAGADDWYEGDNSSVADHDNTGVELKLYNAAGTAITSGSTTTPIAAFAAAAGTVRADDTFATLFVHLPESDTAPGAWPGVQVTGTSKFSGAGAVTAPASLAGKPYVATSADGYTLADVAAILPNTETAASFAGVYELRLRTSSPADGVSTEYAAAYVKITGSTWAVTTPPVLGGGGPTGTATPTATATPTPTTNPSPTSGPTATTTSGAPTTSSPTPSVTPTTGTTAKKKPGKPVLKVTTKPTPKKGGAATVTVATPAGLAKATGKVSLVIKKGKTTFRVKGTVKAGVAKLKLPKLAKGSWTVTITYAGDANYLSSSAKSKVASK